MTRQKFTHRTATRWGIATMIGMLFVAGCAANSDDEAEPPDAPRQQQPQPAEAHAESTEGVPISELVDAQWSDAVASEHGIPQRAMLAYGGAALRIAETHPECQIGWNTLAAIGSVETSHASFDEAGLDSQGVATPEIIGPVLDGSDGVMEVEDTDNGKYDGDTAWDRAVGPMQFLPETWQTHAVDGNRDGETDPHQIDDAVLTAGIYLCESTDDLTDDDDWVQAVTTYNQAMDYARDVAAVAAAYEDTASAAASAATVVAIR